MTILLIEQFPELVVPLSYLLILFLDNHQEKIEIQEAGALKKMKSETMRTELILVALIEEIEEKDGNAHANPLISLCTVETFLPP